MLAAALRRHRGDGAFHDLEQRLLHALARHVAGDRRVVGLAGNLVDFVDIDDAALRALDIVVGRLQQLEDDVLHVLADVAGFGERGGVRHRERHVEDARQRLRQQRLARAGRPDQQDVRLRQFDVVMLGLMIEALVVIVHSDREHLFGMVLADHVVVEDLADFLRRRNAVARLHQRGLVLLADDVHAQLDALVADEHGRAGNELAHLVLALAAERASRGCSLNRFRPCSSRNLDQHATYRAGADRTSPGHGRERRASERRARRPPIVQDFDTECDAGVAEKHTRAGHQLFHLVPALAAERAAERGAEQPADRLAHSCLSHRSRHRQRRHRHIPVIGRRG